MEEGDDGREAIWLEEDYGICLEEIAIISVAEGPHAQLQILQIPFGQLQIRNMAERSLFNLKHHRNWIMGEALFRAEELMPMAKPDYA